MNTTLASLAALALLTSCMATGPSPASPAQDLSRPGVGPPAHRMSAVGWLGLSEMETRDIVSGSNNSGVVSVDEATMPAIGGAFQRPLGGQNVVFGIEGGISFGWQGGVNAVAIGNGGVAISAESDVFITDLFGGPYLMIPLNQNLRLYGSTGLVLEWGWFDYDWDDANLGHVSFDQDGVGGGYYGRAGFEFYLGNGAWIGLGLRAVDTSINPGGEVDTIELRQIQYLFTLTRAV